MAVRASRPRRVTMVLLAGMALAHVGCGDDDETLDSQALRPVSPLEQIRSLTGGEQRLEKRPGSCRRTHAVLIAAGKPQPARLRVRPGDCVIWGNKGAAQVELRSTTGPPRTTGNRTLGALFGIGMTIGGRAAAGKVLGPFTRLTPGEAFSEAKPGGEDLPYPYGAADRPVKVSYTITPGGGNGAIFLLPGGSRPSKLESRGLASGVERIRRLRGGDRRVKDRPAGCKTTHAVVIAGGEAEPPTLTVELGDCVIWGNTGAANVEVASAVECGASYRSCSSFSRTVGRNRAAGAVGPLKNSHADLGGRIPYTIEPGGGKGTIILK